MRIFLVDKKSFFYFKLSTLYFEPFSFIKIIMSFFHFNPLIVLFSISWLYENILLKLWFNFGLVAYMVLCPNYTMVPIMHFRPIIILKKESTCACKNDKNKKSAFQIIWFILFSNYWTKKDFLNLIHDNVTSWHWILWHSFSKSKTSIKTVE